MLGSQVEEAAAAAAVPRSAQGAVPEGIPGGADLQVRPRSRAAGPDAGGEPGQIHRPAVGARGQSETYIKPPRKWWGEKNQKPRKRDREVLLTDGMRIGWDWEEGGDRTEKGRFDTGQARRRREGASAAQPNSSLLSHSLHAGAGLPPAQQRCSLLPLGR